MHPLARFIYRLLSHPIAIDVSPSRFSFTRSGHVVELETKVYISTVSGKIIGVGQGVSPTEPFYQASLFDGRTSSSGHTKFAVLEAFIRYGFALCSRSVTMLRPVVTFRGSDTLASVTGGYQEQLLASAATSAGALECKFERAV